MVDQLSPPNTCRVCGAPLNTNSMSTEAAHGLCDRCVQNKVASWPSTETQATGAPYPPHQYEAPEQAPVPDPDRPRWGAGTGIATWVASIAAILFVPIAAVIFWYILDKARGVHIPDLANSQELMDWVMSPRLLLVQVYSTLAAHVVTLAVCWAVVTKFGKQPFLKSLGWDWAGHSALYWLLISVGVLVMIVIADQVFTKFLPQSETSFDQLLKSSQQVKIAVVLLAITSAPIVEEVIYRGILYAGLRKQVGTVATVIGVTILFSSVHVLQYWGAWASMAGLTMLSLILTIVRAKTKSILPCVVIHFANNFFSSIIILLSKS